MKRGRSKPVAYSSMVKPAGSCSRATLGRGITCGRLVADSVANGGGNLRAAPDCERAAPALPKAPAVKERKLRRFMNTLLPGLWCGLARRNRSRLALHVAVVGFRE